MITVKNNKQWLVVGALLVLGSSAAQAWWKGDWSSRTKITVTPSAAGISGEVGDAPVLVRLHEGDFQFDIAKPDGSDLRFIAADDKTELAFHLEKYDPDFGEGYAWVKLPGSATKSGDPTTIYLYYGNPNAPDTADAKGTYDENTSLVYHFAEKGAPPHDSTTNAADATTPGTAVQSSLIGSGVRFLGQNVITLPAAPALNWPAGGSITWSAWIKFAALQPNILLFSRRDTAGTFNIGLDNGVPFAEINGQRTAGGTAGSVSAWHHLAVVVNATQVTVYLDGTAGGVLAAALPALNSTSTLGGDGAYPGYDGELDELQISKVARSPGFIKFAAIGQGTDANNKLIALEIEAHTNWLTGWMKGGFLGVILGSVTIDGWIVIGLLIIMGVGSWMVMVRKHKYLNTISLGNDLFMKEWHHLSSDLTALDHGNQEQVKSMGGRVDTTGQAIMHQASIYRIYQIGAEEVRHRLVASSARGGRVLSPQSMQAIRASLETGLVREMQKLNELMVVLTTCISGGPFLGLLGTVVGVMITFAAIAAAGDVNVNAIAPGIAAALVATVAGLGVAIPALFGYNYLISRIKDTSTNMHVFVDEFVAKMAEFYRSREDETPDI